MQGDKELVDLQCSITEAQEYEGEETGWKTRFWKTTECFCDNNGAGRYGKPTGHSFEK